MVDGAEGVATEGGVGLVMFEGGSFLGLSVLGPLLRCWCFGGVVVVKVPRWRWQVPIEAW